MNNRSEAAGLMAWRESPRTKGIPHEPGDRAVGITFQSDQSMGADQSALPCNADEAHGIMALYRKPNTLKSAPGPKIYRYLLRTPPVTRLN